jgi:hypothetical protein
MKSSMIILSKELNSSKKIRKEKEKNLPVGSIARRRRY